jgi:hypothetical protein
MKISKLVPAIGIFAFCVSFGSVRAQDNPAQAAARAALMKQMDQVQAPEPQTPPAAPAAPAAPAEPAAPVVVVTPKPAAEAAPAVSNAAGQDAARAALMQMMHSTNSQQPVTTQGSAPTAASPVPIVAPSLPISMTKEQRLQALLARYKADQITPEEYHKQRATILAEP